MQGERPKREIEHELRGLGPESLAPGIRLADGDVIERRAVLAIKLTERTAPDQTVRGPFVDGHRERIGADHTGGEESLDLLRPHRRRLVSGQPRDLRIGVPTVERGQIRRDMAAQDHAGPPQDLREPRFLSHPGHGIPSRFRGCGRPPHDPGPAARPRAPGASAIDGEVQSIAPLGPAAVVDRHILVAEEGQHER